MTYDGYNIIQSGGYPAIYKDGKICRIHVLEMEKFLGRKLRSPECVHHLDKDKQNYDIRNLVCFRSNADHVGFHKGLSYILDDNGIAYCPNMYQNKSKSSHKAKVYLKVCPVCGNCMSYNSRMCIDCYKKQISNFSKKPSKDVLIGQFNDIHNLTHIGKIYDVSANTVKKWLLSYDIVLDFRCKAPDKYVLMQQLCSDTVVDVAKLYSVSFDVVKTWIRKYDIYIIKKQIVCVEFGSSYDSMLKAADDVYPLLSRKGAAYNIGQIIDTEKEYHGYHWCSTDKVVFSLSE